MASFLSGMSLVVVGGCCMPHVESWSDHDTTKGKCALRALRAVSGCEDERVAPPRGSETCEGAAR